MRRIATALGFIALSAAMLSGYLIAHAQTLSGGTSVVDPAVIAANSPVKSVNGGTGVVVVPATQRQISSPLDISSGTVSWTFPIVFTNAPTCFVSLASTNTQYVFDYPITSSTLGDKTKITITETAHSKSLLVGVLFSSVNPPSGTTATISCIGALP